MKTLVGFASSHKTKLGQIILRKVVVTPVERRLSPHRWHHLVLILWTLTNLELSETQSSHHCYRHICIFLTLVGVFEIFLVSSWIKLGKGENYYDLKYYWIVPCRRILKQLTWSLNLFKWNHTVFEVRMNSSWRGEGNRILKIIFTLTKSISTKLSWPV